MQTEISVIMTSAGLPDAPTWPVRYGALEAATLWPAELHRLHRAQPPAPGNRECEPICLRSFNLRARRSLTRCVGFWCYVDALCGREAVEVVEAG